MKKGLIIGTSVMMIGLLFLLALTPAKSPIGVDTLGVDTRYKAVVCTTITRANGDIEEAEWFEAFT